MGGSVGSAPLPGAQRTLLLMLGLTKLGSQLTVLSPMKVEAS